MGSTASVFLLLTREEKRPYLDSDYMTVFLTTREDDVHWVLEGPRPLNHYQGPKEIFRFALTVLELLRGREKREQRNGDVVSSSTRGNDVDTLRPSCSRPRQRDPTRNGNGKNVSEM